MRAIPGGTGNIYNSHLHYVTENSTIAFNANKQLSKWRGTILSLLALVLAPQP